jgi:hypothetical protein
MTQAAPAGLRVVIPATDGPPSLQRCREAWRHHAGAASALAAVGALALGGPRVATAALAAMICSDMSFYVLRGRQGGTRLALARVPLHLLHHLTAALSVPVGVAAWARRAGA